MHVQYSLLKTRTGT